MTIPKFLLQTMGAAASAVKRAGDIKTAPDLSMFDEDERTGIAQHGINYLVERLSQGGIAIDFVAERIGALYALLPEEAKEVAVQRISAVHKEYQAEIFSQIGRKDKVKEIAHDFLHPQWENGVISYKPLETIISLFEQTEDIDDDRRAEIAQTYMEDHPSPEALNQALKFFEKLGREPGVSVQNREMLWMRSEDLLCNWFAYPSTYDKAPVAEILQRIKPTLEQTATDYIAISHHLIERKMYTLAEVYAESALKMDEKVKEEVVKIARQLGEKGRYAWEYALRVATQTEFDYEKVLTRLHEKMTDADGLILMESAHFKRILMDLEGETLRSAAIRTHQHAQQVMKEGGDSFYLHTGVNFVKEAYGSLGDKRSLQAIDSEYKTYQSRRDERRAEAARSEERGNRYRFMGKTMIAHELMELDGFKDLVQRLDGDSNLIHYVERLVDSYWGPFKESDVKREDVDPVHVILAAHDWDPRSAAPSIYERIAEHRLENGAEYLYNIDDPTPIFDFEKEQEAPTEIRQYAVGLAFLDIADARRDTVKADLTSALGAKRITDRLGDEKVSAFLQKNFVQYAT
ncbi:hypothetical protein GOV09_05640 [Candidatus Woesearchaeota archaeon]|nr:hypothetical protein [Candidatus Woesearchaeota archaeon]